MNSSNHDKTTAKKQKAFKLLQTGKLGEALKIAEQLCRQNKNDAESHYILGSIYGELKRYEQAVARFKTCIDLQPDAFVAYLNMGQAYTGLKDLAAAESAYRSALKLQADNLYVKVRLAEILAEQSNLDVAEEMLLKVLDVQPESADALDTLGDICRDKNRYQEAITYYEHALNVEPGRVDTLLNLGNCQLLLGQTDKAVKHFQKLVTLAPLNVTAFVHMGHCLKHNGEPDKARIAYENALAIEPNNLTALVGIIDLCEREGNFDDAYELLLPQVKRGYDEADLAAAFIRLCDRYNSCDEAIEYAQKVLHNTKLSKDDITRLEYALGRKFDKMGDFDNAFTHYARANNLKQQEFDTHAHTAFIDALINTYTWNFFTQAPRSTVRSSRPVFIVGMPRSGTSLIEQILASHPDVYGAGELTDVGDAIQSLGSGGNMQYPHCMNNIDVDTLDRIANQYLGHLNDLSPDAARITDKQPTNFLHLGLIALAFPDARIIHCTRNAIDNCLSIYFQDFSDANRYANRLEHIGLYYRQYEKLMQHIKGLLGIPVLDVPYEELVNNQEAMTRKLLDFVDLGWNDNCLLFHRNRRYVATPSYDQVRESIYTRAIGRWKNYEKHLQMLLKSLNIQ